MEKIVIFDMDGVLVDTEPVYYKRLEDFLISRGYAFPRAVLDRLVGESSRKTFSILKQADPAFYDSEETYRRDYRAYHQGQRIDYRELANPHVHQSAEKHWLAPGSGVQLTARQQRTSAPGARDPALV